MRRTWPQRLFIGFSIALVVALLGTAGGLAYFFTKYSQLPRIDLGRVLSTDQADAGSSRNVLIVGVDSAAGLDPDNPIRSEREDLGIGGLRSDTIMILRVDPDDPQAHLLSLPRDLWLPIAGRGNQRINTAVGQGGPTLLVATIQQYFNIPINNYVQIDFAGFQELVEAIDGVPVYFDTPVRDRLAGLDVPEAGCVTLSPSQALAYARSRAFQYQVDGRWRTDPTGDLGRISRQQDFLRRALRRAVSRGARNPVTLDALIDAALDAVVVDDSLSAQQIASLGNRIRGFNPQNLVQHALPVEEGYAGGASIVRMIESEAQPILEIFRGSDPGALTPSAVRVGTLNGSGVSGEAGAALSALTAAGFATLSAGEAERFDFARTTVRYAPGSEAAADLVARWLVVPPVIEPVEGIEGGSVVVVTGSDWAGVRDEPRPPSASTTTSAPTTSTPTTTSSTTGSSRSISTSSTIVGHVPEQPEDVSC